MPSPSGSSARSVERWLAALSAEPTHRQRRTFYAGLALAWALVGATHVARFGAPAFVDDAYITIHNAYVLLFQEDPNYAGSSALTGATSAPHAVLIALLIPLLGGAWSAWAVSFMGTGLYLFGLGRLGFKLGLSWIANAGVSFAALTLANTLYQLFNGLETSLALAGLTWTLCFAMQGDLRGDRSAAALSGLLPFLRPELVLAGVVLGMHLIQRESARGGGARAGFLALLRLLPFALITAAPWLLLYAANTGTPIPSTISAKRAYFAEGCASTSWKLKTYASIFGRFALECGPWLLALLFLPLRTFGALWLGFIAVFCAVYYVSFPGALGHYQHRYLYVMAPLLVLGLGYGLVHARLMLRKLAFGVLGAAVCYGAYRLPAIDRSISKVVGFARNELFSLGAFANARLPEGATLLIHDAGYISYATEFALVDIVGLKTPRNVHWHRELTWPSCGRQRHRALHEIALRSHAQYFVVLSGWDRIYGLSYGLMRHGWRVLPVRLREHGYHVLRIFPPGARLPHGDHRGASAR